MKIWEIELKEGKQFKVTSRTDEYFLNNIFTVDKLGRLVDNKGDSLARICFLRDILKLEFEELIDWNEIPVDTKVLVSDDGESWYKEYFSYTLNTMFYTFDGGTSWNNKENTIGWSYCKLAED